MADLGDWAEGRISNDASKNAEIGEAVQCCIVAAAVRTAGHYLRFCVRMRGYELADAGDRLCPGRRAGIKETPERQLRG